MFNYTLNECFVEREHQDSWKPTTNANYPNYIDPIYNREVENIEVGSDYNIEEYGIGSTNYQPAGLYWVEVIATQPLGVEPSGTTDYNIRTEMFEQFNVHTGLYVYLFPVYKYNTIENSNFTLTGTITYGTVQEQVTHSIWGAFQLPYMMKSTAIISYRVLPYSPVKCTITNIISSSSTGINVNIPDGCKWVTVNNTDFGGVNMATVGGYVINLVSVTPENANYNIGVIEKPAPLPIPSISNQRNKRYEPKLNTYPYNYIMLTDYQSQPLIVKKELLDTNKDVMYVQSVGAFHKSKIYLNNYNGDYGKYYNTVNNTISELPLLNDAYLNYIAQNKASATAGVAVNVATGVASLGLGLATGGIGLVAGLGMALSQGQQIANQVIKMQDLKDTPDSLRQTGNNAEFDIADDNIGVVGLSLTIKTEFMEKLYNYLYHYGYKCNNFKVPNTRSRYYFNYIKTIGATLNTNIDTEWTEKIKQVYDNGVTIWHYRDANTFKGVNNYDYENVQVNLIGGNNG